MSIDPTPERFEVENVDLSEFVRDVFSDAKTLEGEELFGDVAVFVNLSDWFEAVQEQASKN